MAALADDLAPEPTIGELLRSLRTARGWSQDALGFAAGVSDTTISGIETGTKRPLYATCVKIADAYGMCGVERERFLAHSTVPVARPSRGRFGRLLRRYRIRAGYSQNALAALAGCNSTWINRLEADARQAMPEIVRAISRALRLTTHETDALLVAAGYVPSFAEDKTVRQLARLLAGDAVLAAAVRAQIQALWTMTREGDEQ